MARAKLAPWPQQDVFLTRVVIGYNSDYARLLSIEMDGQLNEETNNAPNTKSQQILDDNQVSWTQQILEKANDVIVPISVSYGSSQTLPDAYFKMQFWGNPTYTLDLGSDILVYILPIANQVHVFPDRTSMATKADSNDNLYVSFSATSGCASPIAQVALTRKMDLNRAILM